MSSFAKPWLAGPGPLGIQEPEPDVRGSVRPGPRTKAVADSSDLVPSV